MCSLKIKKNCEDDLQEEQDDYDGQHDSGLDQKRLVRDLARFSLETGSKCQWLKRSYQNYYGHIIWDEWGCTESKTYYVFLLFDWVQE